MKTIEALLWIEKFIDAIPYKIISSEMNGLKWLKLLIIHFCRNRIEETKKLKLNTPSESALKAFEQLEQLTGLVKLNSFTDKIMTRIVDYKFL